MSESGDYDPGPWRGYDFKSARADYDAHVGRSYSDALTRSIDPRSLIPRTLETKSNSPLVIACDVTGSMEDWPATIFSKLPYLDLEGKEYLGDSMEISFAAIGDAYSDTYALQVKEFVSGKGLEEKLKELVIEGGGGGQTTESYDLAALYYSRNVNMPNAISPIFIFIGDEGFYPFVDKQHAESWTYNKIEGRLGTKRLLSELKSKYSVYMIRKPYKMSSGDGISPQDHTIHQSWADSLGEDHIAILPEAGRVVDVIFGILAKETGRIEYFEGELKGRQKPEQVKTVLKSLHSLHYLPSDDKKKLPPGTSVTRKRKGEGKESSALI